MTDSSSANGSNNSKNASQEKVCRDFLRKVCRRGNRCKFLHIEANGDVKSENNSSNINNNRSNGSDLHKNSMNNDSVNNNQGGGTAVSATQANTHLTFCHDYQNSHCNRNTCKFIHCTCEEENQYLQTGHIPPHVLDQAIRKGQMSDATLNGDVPICKDFLTGECEKRRGGRCKFRHLTLQEYHREIYGSNGNEPNETVPNTVPSQQTPYRLHHYPSSMNPPELVPPTTRRMELDRFEERRELIMAGPPKRPRLDVIYSSYPHTEDLYEDDSMGGVRRGVEMALMRKQMENMQQEINVLKKENSDLRATNDFLLDKVTTLGASKLNGHVSTSASSLPAASMTAPTLPAPTLVAAAAASSIPSLTASLSAGTAQVTHATHALNLAPPMSMAVPRTVVHPTIAAPPTIAHPSIAPPTEAVQHPLSITSISADGSVGSVVAIAAAPPQPPPPSQPPPPPPPQPIAPQAVAVGAPPPTAVVVSVNTVQVPLSQAAITITSGTVDPRLTSTSMSMSLPSMAPPAPAIVPSIGQAMSGAPPGPVVAANNIAQAISLSQAGQALSLPQQAAAIQHPPISMAAISGPPMSMSGAPGGQLLSYPIISQPAIRTQLH